ncbi:HSP20-like chaperone [Hypoxylon sp. FL1150]|nr:HSP20-like chaperone [Hypoxylon sp. FL1150]
MANNNQQAPFWEFIQSFDPSTRAGVGVDHANANAGPQFPGGFPFDGSQFNNQWFGHGPWGRWGGGPWGPGHHGPGRHHHGHHGHHGYRDVPDSDREEDQDDEMEGSPETMRPTPDSSAAGDVPPPPSGSRHPPPPNHSGAGRHHPPPPPSDQPPHHPFHHGPQAFGPHRGRGGRGGRGGRCGRRARHGSPPPAYSGPWDFRPLMHAFASHPFAQNFRDYMDQTRGGAQGESNEQQEDVFVPPVDTFNTEKAYILHVSLPGAAKEDIGVNWDGEKVSIAGVVHRPGNEEFLQSLTSSERKVGMFERTIKLPPPGSEEKEEVDGLSITAKLENGILIVTVPKTEKEWTEIHKVDIE